MSMENEEKLYLYHAEKGLQPQQLKRLYPLGGKAELRLCGFDDAWQNFFWRRCDDHADPECRKVANTIRDLYNMLA
jgi:thymidylate synthase ThyX